MDRVEKRLTPAREIQPDVWVGEPVTAIYDPADPYAITWRFDAGQEWLFGRDLLAQGIVANCGDGDVSFRPDNGAVHVTWGSLTVIVLRKALADFLNATTALVPLGEETVDWDREMRALGGAR